VLDLFGAGGGAEVARALSGEGADVPVLASIPLSPSLRSAADAGDPIVVADPTDAAAQAISQLAAALASQPRGLTGRKLPVSPR